MMLNYDLTKLPGQWRPGDVFVGPNLVGTAFTKPQMRTMFLS